MLILEEADCSGASDYSDYVVAQTQFQGVFDIPAAFDAIWCYCYFLGCTEMRGY